MSYFIETWFTTECFYGKLGKAQWLYRMFPTFIGASARIEALQIACQEGYIQMAKWIYSIDPTINIAANNERAIWVASSRGYFDIVEWLLFIKPTAISGTIFRFACYHGRLAFAQWILSAYPTINISEKKDWAFRMACGKNQPSIALWFQQINPDKYKIININSRPIQYEISIQLKFHSEGWIVSQLNTCSICISNMCDVKTSCGHYYCSTCMLDWIQINNICPDCRRDLSTSLYHKVELKT